MPLYPPQIQTVMDPWGTHECRLDWVSTSTVRLSRWGGQWLMINGVRQSIPAAGLDVGVASLDGNYFVWAYMLSGALALYFEGTTNAPVLDPNGMPVHPLNAALTLVGVIYAPAGTLPHHGYVCSYWNRRQRVVASGIVTQQSGSTSYVELNTGMRCMFTMFGGDTYEIYCSGSGWSINVDGLIVMTGLAIDNVIVGQVTYIHPHYASWYCPVAKRMTGKVPPGGHGAHALQVYGAINAAGYTGHWQLATGVRWLG
jgi:hypothetical protein